MSEDGKLSEQIRALSHGALQSAEQLEHVKLVQMDEIYEKAGSYGRYQILQFIFMMALTIGGASNSAGGYLSLGMCEGNASA